MIEDVEQATGRKFGSPVSLEIDGSKRVRYVLIMMGDQQIGVIGVDFSYHRYRIPNGEPLDVRLFSSSSGGCKFREGRIFPDLDMAARTREIYPQHGRTLSAYRFFSIEPLLAREGERLVLCLSAGEGGAYMVRIEDSSNSIVAEDMVFAKIESSINGGGSWDHAGYRNLHACGFVLLP